MGCSETRRPSRLAPLPSQADTTLRTLFVPVGMGATPTGLEKRYRFPRPGFGVETTGFPKFLGNPHTSMPCSSTPAVSAPSLDLVRRFVVAFRKFKNVGSRKS